MELFALNNCYDVVSFTPELIEKLKFKLKGLKFPLDIINQEKNKAIAL